MISFELSAIDLILVLSVLVLLILYMTKLSAKTPEKKSFKQPTEKDVNSKYFGKLIRKLINPFSKGIKTFRRYFKNRSVSKPPNNHTECPRGFGNIKKRGEDKSVSEMCLGCFKLMECYSEKKLRITNQ